MIGDIETESESELGSHKKPTFTKSRGTDIVQAARQVLSEISDYRQQSNYKYQSANNESIGS